MMSTQKCFLIFVLISLHLHCHYLFPDSYCCLLDLQHLPPNRVSSHHCLLLLQLIFYRTWKEGDEEGRESIMSGWKKGTKEGRRKREKKREGDKGNADHLLLLLKSSFWLPTHRKRCSFLFWSIPSHLSHSVLRLSLWYRSHPSLIVSPAVLLGVDRFMFSDILFLLPPLLQFFHLAYPTQLS